MRSRMRELATEIEIDAPADRVWSILTDFSLFPEWNPFIQEAEGEVREGARLKVHMETPGGRGMTFKPTVTRVEPEREFRWLGHLLIPGLFDGEHIFQIESSSENAVRFIQRERFRGLLIPLLWRRLAIGTRRGFNEMNVALKRQAEEGEH